MTGAAVGPRIANGDPLTLGLRQVPGGWNLAVFSRHAAGVTLLLFEPPTPGPIATIPLDPDHHRTGDVWHACISGEWSGRGYALRVDGPWQPEQGHRFDATRNLLDPYAEHVQVETPTGCQASFVSHDFDWRDDRSPRHAWRDTVLYETHVRGLTFHPSSGSVHRGRYLGIIDKIPYFRELGVTTLELMPVQEFLDAEVRSEPDGDPVRNYWGYNPVALFAPKASYAEDQSASGVLNEFKTMVRELHKANIEVILDVVFNHTAEGGDAGPTLSFRGLENAVYYLLQPGNGRYVDFTGCGNTLNCNHPIVRSLIIDCLRHWTAHFHVDGFRFDLASILGRDPEGRLLPNPPLLEHIAEDPILRDVKLIAEAWDLGGAFQVGGFPGHRWAEWNCHFRDDVRRFWRGDPGMAGAFATRLCGSADLYRAAGKTPRNSVNFITSHDGFTLNDLVSFNHKHNEQNREQNRDGVSENYSDNNGVEGPTEDAAVERARLKQIKNLLVSLFLSRGVPMLLGGDEFRRSQRGNNNAYCQDNEISWYDWSLVKRNAGLVRFVARLIAFRRAHRVLSAERFYSEDEITWFGSEDEGLQWHGAKNRLGCLISTSAPDEGPALCLLFNAGPDACRFRLPRSESDEWVVVIDTNLEDAGATTADQVYPSGDTVELIARSTLVLVAQKGRSSS